MLNSRRTAIFVLVFLFCIVFSGCTMQASTQTFTQIPQPTKQFTAEIKSPTSFHATIEPSITSTVKPTSTSTPFPFPSDTPTVHNPTNTPTVNIQVMLTEQALALKETHIASFAVTCGGLFIENFNNFFTLLSPNRNWLAISCMDPGNSTMKVYNKTGKVWELHFGDYVSKEFIKDGQISRGTLYPIKWTNDEKYLYFRSTLSISAGGTCFYGGWGQGLYRLDVSNGNVSATLPPLKGGMLYIISFSPSGRWLAFNSGVPTILDLQTGEEIILQEGKNAVGDFNWSPDGSKLAYSTCQGSTEDINRIRESAIRIFALDTREARTVLASKTENVFLRIDKVSNNMLKIYDYSRYPPDVDDVFFDWSTNQLFTPTVTPTP